MSIDGILFWGKAIPVLLLILVGLVLVHELGHFIVARLTGVRVLEFGIGFPPKARVLGHDHETEYTLNWLPIGGFVRLEGEESDSDDPRSLSNAPLPSQLLVMVAGVFMNLVAAVLLLFAVAWIFNPMVQPVVATVVPNSPAEAAGIHEGDTLISIDGRTHSLLDFGADPLASWQSELRSRAGQRVTLVLADSSGKQRTVAVDLRVPDDKHPGALGVSMGFSFSYTAGNPVDALGASITGTTKALGLVLVAVGDIGNQIATNPGQGPSGVQGPVGIAQDVGHLLSQNDAPMLLLLLAGILSANLALVNILPFPPLDGGKVAVMVVKRIFGMRGVGALEIATNLIGFGLLMAFIAWISYFDIIRAGQ
ncbi:MAG: M50 family metallopeptidase [Candidatus Limnocylindrales bacterium]